MELSELLKIRGMSAQIERETGVSKQNINNRVKNGWMVGELNGRLVMYNPKMVTQLGEHHRALIENNSKK